MEPLNLADWKILAVDDEPDNLSLLQDILSFFETTVKTASSGPEALEMLRHELFSLALVDIQMPKMSGWDVIREIRGSETSELRELLVIAVTAVAMLGDKEKVLAAGFDGYVSKPIEVEAFIHTLQTIVNERTVNKQAEANQVEVDRAEIPSDAASNVIGTDVMGKDTTTETPSNVISNDEAVNE